MEWSELSGEARTINQSNTKIVSSSERFITDPANVANLFGMGLVQFLGMQVESKQERVRISVVSFLAF